MARIDDSPELFGEGSGTGTTNKFKCDICGTQHPERDVDDDTLHTTEFAGLNVGACCFERIENAVLGRMSYILPWFIKIIEQREKLNARNRAFIVRVKKSLK